jgi:pimeloyl-ACP methyl ester carboxylesterase
MRTEPVLLVHGFATSAQRTWAETGWIDLIREAGREVIAVDLLGHGDAPKPHDPAAYDGMEDHVLEQLPEGRVDAISFSMGARLTLTLAARHPERFGRIVVAGVGENLFRTEGGGTISAAIESDEVPENQIARHFRELAHAPGNDPAALAACMRRSYPPLDEEQLGRIASPVLVVLGDQDFVGPADRLVAALPDARLLTLKKVDHFGTPKDFTFIDEALAFIDARPF